MNSILLPLVFATYSYILYLSYYLYFYKVSNPNEMVEFNIHQKRMEIGLNFIKENGLREHTSCIPAK